MNRATTGITGLDEILQGGVPEEMVYLVHGGPGTGKTTLGFQFLLEGVRQGQRVLYASLLQSRRELDSILRSHHWSLDGIDLLELPENVKQASMEEQTLFRPSDVELHEVIDSILKTIVAHKPQRLLFDSITELAVLVSHPYQLRRQLLKLKQKLSGLGCTTFFTVNDTESIDLASIQTVVHGVIQLGVDRLDYGLPRRWLEVTKMRGMPFLEGRHDFRILTGGLEVYPCVTPSFVGRQIDWQVVSSGNQALDALFGGGLEEGSACLLTGTTGAGKSTLASLYAQAAARRGEKSVIYCFDERKETFLRRSKGLNLEIDRYIDQGLIDLRQINVGQITPGQFTHEIRQATTEQQIKVIVIDSINGYYHAMQNQSLLLVQLHELLSYLSGAGVLTFIVAATHGITQNVKDIDASYIADTVVLMRSFEASGQVRRCISVLKKRHGDHEKSIREIMIDHNGMRVSEPLRQFQGVLTGAPVFIGQRETLLEERSSHERGQAT